MTVHIGPTPSTASATTTTRTCSTSPRAIRSAVDFDETPGGHAVSFDENGDLVGLTLVDIGKLLDESDGELLLELPAKASQQT